jgi:hypothetical protein
MLAILVASKVHGVSPFSWPTTFLPLWVVLISGNMCCGLLLLFSMFLLMFSADVPRHQQRIHNRADLRKLGLAVFGLFCLFTWICKSFTYTLGWLGNKLEGKDQEAVDMPLDTILWPSMTAIFVGSAGSFAFMKYAFPLMDRVELGLPPRWGAAYERRADADDPAAVQEMLDLPKPVFLIKENSTFFKACNNRTLEKTLKSISYEKNSPDMGIRRKEVMIQNRISRGNGNVNEDQLYPSSLEKNPQALTAIEEHLNDEKPVENVAPTLNELAAAGLERAGFSLDPVSHEISTGTPLRHDRNKLVRKRGSRPRKSKDVPQELSANVSLNEIELPSRKRKGTRGERESNRGIQNISRDDFHCSAPSKCPKGGGVSGKRERLHGLERANSLGAKFEVDDFARKRRRFLLDSSCVSQIRTGKSATIF